MTCGSRSRKRRPPGTLLLSGCHRPTAAALRALLAERFTVVVADLQDARWRESNLLFCYQLARCLVEGVRQVDASAAPIAPKKELFAGRPFSTLSLTVDEIEQDAQRRQRYVCLILDNYDQLDEGLKAGRLSATEQNRALPRELTTRPCARRVAGQPPAATESCWPPSTTARPGIR